MDRGFPIQNVRELAIGVKVAYNIYMSKNIAEELRQRGVLQGFSRRKIIKIGVGAVGILTACSPALPPKPSEKIPATNEFLKPITKAEIRTLINNLRESPYKSFIRNLGLPFFEDTLPSKITIGGVSMPLYPTVLAITQEPGNIGGRATIRNLTIHNPTISTVKGDPNSKVIAFVPYLYGEGESTPISVPFQDGRKIASGVGARISLNFPPDVPLTKDLASVLPGLRVASLIKEGMTVAVQSGMMASMKTEPMAVDTTQGGKVEALSQTYTDLSNQKGKFTAYMDWIPLILGVKALQDNSSAIAALRSFKNYNNTVGEILKMDFGNSVQDLIPNTAKWIRQNLALMTEIGNIGNFDQLP